jgi:hypothetical protein
MIASQPRPKTARQLIYDITIQYNQRSSTGLNLDQPKSDQLCDHSIGISMLAYGIS